MWPRYRSQRSLQCKNGLLDTHDAGNRSDLYRRTEAVGADNGERSADICSLEIDRTATHRRSRTGLAQSKERILADPDATDPDVHEAGIHDHGSDHSFR